MYYILNHSLNLKTVGKFPQSENITNVDYENPNHIVNNYLKKIDFEPIAPIPILLKKSIVTDLISNSNAGGLLHLLVSEKLKNIILKHRTEGLQFFKTHLIQNDCIIDNYFSLNIWENNNELIDFRKTTFNYRKYDALKINEIEEIKFNSLIEFNHFLQNKNMFDELTYKSIYLISNNSYNFFMLKDNVKFIISEKMKKEIEDAGCTGIEFQPIELSYNEWTASGGEREKIYGKL